MSKIINPSILTVIITMMTMLSSALNTETTDSLSHRLQSRDLADEIPAENCQCPSGYRFNTNRGLCEISQRCSGICLDGHCQCEFSCMSHLRNGQCVGSFSNFCSRNQYGIISRNLPVCNGAQPTVAPSQCTCSDNRYRIVNVGENGHGRVCRVLRCPSGQRCVNGRCQCPFECQSAHRGGCIGAGLNGCGDSFYDQRFTGHDCSV